jgi:hypothetical protein
MGCYNERPVTVLISPEWTCRFSNADYRLFLERLNRLDRVDNNVWQTTTTNYDRFVKELEADLHLVPNLHDIVRGVYIVPSIRPAKNILTWPAPDNL